MIRPGKTLVLQNLEEHWDSSQGPVDLSSCEFIDAAGLVFLAFACYENSMRGHYEYIPPVNRNCRSYLDRMKVPQALKQLGIRSDRPPNEFGGNPNLFELTMVRSTTEIAGLANVVYDKWEQVDPEAAEDLALAVIEATNNVFDHADMEWALVAAQTYGSGTPNERVVLSVGDSGISFLGSIANQGYDSHESAIQDIFLKNVKSRKRSEGGCGLKTLSEAIERVPGGRMLVRSGEASVTVEGNKRPTFSGQLSHLPGTLVAVDLPVRTGGR